MVANGVKQQDISVSSEPDPNTLARAAFVNPSPQSTRIQPAVLMRMAKSYWQSLYGRVAKPLILYGKRGILFNKLTRQRNPHDRLRSFLNLPQETV